MDNDKGFALLNQAEGWDARHFIAGICIFLAVISMLLKFTMHMVGSDSSVLLFQKVEIASGILALYLLIMAKPTYDAIKMDINSFLGSVLTWWPIELILWSLYYYILLP